MLSKASMVTGIAAAAALLVTPMAQAHPAGAGRLHSHRDTDFSNNNFNTGDQFCSNAQATEGDITGGALASLTQTLSSLLGSTPPGGGNQGQVLSPQTNACINGSNDSHSAVRF